MGSTIKRKPVSFSIPAEPSYKFLNITEFNGLDITDNPFTAKVNTASDCLNVYVDESNALTTRPRLEKMYDITNNISGFTKLIKVYPLQTATIFQVLVNNSSVAFYHYENNTLNNINRNGLVLTDKKYAVFEKDDIFYIAGNGIYVYYKNTEFKLQSIINSDIAYVPITGIGDIATGVINTNENKNLLTDKYRTSYYWDLKSNPNKIYENNGKLIDNGYHKRYESEDFEPVSVGGLSNGFVCDDGSLLAYSLSTGGDSTGRTLEVLSTTTSGGKQTIKFDIPGWSYSKEDYLHSQIVYNNSSGWITDVVDNESITMITGTNTAFSSLSVGTQISNVTITANDNSKFRRIYLAVDSVEYEDAFVLPEKIATISSSGQIFVIFNADDKGFAIYDRRSNTYEYVFLTGDYKSYYMAPGNTRYGKSAVNNEGTFVLVVASTTQTIDDDGNWVLLSYTKNTTSNSGYTQQLIHNNKDVSNFLTGYNVDVKYDPYTDNCICYENGGAKWFQYITKLSSSERTSVRKKWLGLSGASFSELSFNSDLSVVAGYKDGSLYVGTITDSEEVSQTIKYLDNNVVDVLSVSADGLSIGFANDKSVFRYDVLTNEYFKLYDVSELSDDTYYTYNTKRLLGLSKDFSLLYRNNLKYNSDGIDVLTKYYIDALTSSTEPLLIIEYSEPSQVKYGEKQTDRMNVIFTSTHSFGGCVYLSQYDKTHFVKIRVYSSDNSNYSEVIIPGSEIESWTEDYGTIYSSSYGAFELRYIYASKQLCIYSVYDTNILYKNVIVETLYSNKIDDVVQTFEFENLLRYQNNYWFYGKDNVLRWSSNNNPTYLPQRNYTTLGDSLDEIIDMCLVSYDTALAFKRNNMYVISPISVGDVVTYSFVEAKSELGVSAPNTTIISPLKEVPLFVNTKGIYGLQQLKNVQSTDRLAVLYSEKINSKYLKETNIQNIKTVRHLYWVMFIVPGQKESGVYLFDDRNGQWYYWTFPINIVDCWEENDFVYLAGVNGKIYTLQTSDLINKYNNELTEYYDDEEKIIPWYWKSQILPLGTINYSKKLIDTTFILSDTDSSDEYAINYTFKAYRKLASETNPTTVSNRLNYVQSITKRTLVHRFKFVQLELSNVEDDLNNNKFRLVGLGLRYVLLEGLIQ